MLRIDINLIFTVINVLVLFVAVRLFLWKPIHKILDERQAMVDQSLATAEQAKAEAKSLAQEYQLRLEGIAQERSAALEEAQAQAQLESGRILDSAQAQARSIVQKAEQDASKRKEEIMRQAQTEISDIILTATAKVSGVSGDSGLYDEFLEKAGNADE